MDRLPPEILLAIVREIRDVDDRLHLVQVCRRWRALLLAIAFRSIHIEWSHLPRLVGVALANTALRSSIHKLSVTEHAPENPRVPLWPAVRDLIDLISESPVEWEEWLKSLSGNCIEAWIAILLPLLPNLTALSACHNRPEGWIARIVSRAAWKQVPFDTNTLPALRHLETLDLTWRDHSIVLGHREYLPFFHLPSLRTVRLGPAQDFQSRYEIDNHPAFHPPPGTSPVESLVLDFFCMGQHGMADFITSCANLKRFIYEHTNEPDCVAYAEEIDFAGWNPLFVPSRFYESLQTQKHSLEVLHLNLLGLSCPPPYSAEYSEYFDSMSHNQWFGPLTDFHKLWDLRIRVSNLLNLYPWDTENVVCLKDILPPSLKFLHLADCAEDDCVVLVPNLRDFLAHQPECFPNLQSLLISPEPENPYGSIIRIRESFRKLMMPLQSVCDRVGVQFSLGVGRKMNPDINQWCPGQIVPETLS